MDKAPERFVIFWGCLAVLVNVITIIGIFIGAGGFWAGWWRVTEIYSPLNFVNCHRRAFYWLQRRQARSAR
jgi:hypothetical protein